MDKQTILIIDDEKSFLDIMRVILPRSGYNILTAGHGREGLQMIYDFKPDLALVDDMLPGISGGDICLTVKSDPKVNDIPVILYSAGPRVRDRDFVRQIGADAVLYKPFKPADIVRVVGECLGGASV